MARRKKSEQTDIRKTTGSQRQHRRSNIIGSRKYAPEEGYGQPQEAKDVSPLRTVIFSLVLLLAVMILSNYRQAHKTDKGDILKVHYIDVGQGDSILIQCGGENMLLDCGEASKADELCSYLKEQDVDSFEYVIGTHFHSDHMGGMSEIVRSYDIGEFIIPPYDAKKLPTDKYFERFLDAVGEKKMKLKKASVGKRYTLGNAEFEVISPSDAKSGDTNNTSVGIVLRYGSTSFFLAGDAGSAVEKEIVKSRDPGHISVYKAGHHGSSSSSSDELLDAIDPDIAVISCGTGNSYGHPNEKALSRIRKHTDRIYRTDKNGSILITSDGAELKVKTERNEQW